MELISMPNPITDKFGTQRWFLNGKYHREDGPAVIYPTGDAVWYNNGKLHREDGPAIIYKDGTQFWYLNDISYTEDAYKIIQFFNGVKLNA
jgi:hypothetical protein